LAIVNVHNTGNSIGDSGTKEIASSMTNMIILQLEGNCLKRQHYVLSQAGLTLGVVAARHTGNSISDEGAKLIAERLKECCNMTTLDLAGILSKRRAQRRFSRFHSCLCW
jgi:hypothetical protein